eukprot:scaffold39185_cov65-Cyclotella_meneghiniana.AAC.1
MEERVLGRILAILWPCHLITLPSIMFPTNVEKVQSFPLPSSIILNTSNILFFLPKGTHKEWLPHVDKLILEMLTNRTPPTCIQANLVAMAEVLCPGMNLVRELPSLKHIKDLRTTLYTVTKTLAAYRLADAKSWKQGHADETSRRQTSLLNFLMGLVTKDDKFKAVCIDLAIIAKNGSAEEQSRAVLSALRDCKTLLEEWRTTTADMYPEKPELIQHIPDPSLIDITRMMGAMIEHDSCNTARRFGSILCDTIKEEIAAKTNLSPQQISILDGDCHNHLRNVWFDHIDSDFGSLLEDHFER